MKMHRLDTGSRLEVAHDSWRSWLLTGVRRDPKDDMLFECAVRAKAEIIVSGDKDVLEVGEYRGIRVITARQYLTK